MTLNSVILTALNKNSEIEQLVADQVGRVSALKAKRLYPEKAEMNLSLLPAKLAIKRAAFSRFAATINTYHLPKKLLRETAEVGGPRWRIGWGESISRLTSPCFYPSIVASRSFTWLLLL